MIRLTLAQLVAAYLCLFLAAIVTLWLSYGARRRLRKARMAKYRLRCTVCGLAYEDQTAVIVPECPRCGSLNERSRELSV